MRDNSISWLSLQWLTTFLGTLSLTQFFRLLESLGLIPLHTIRITLVCLALIAISYWLIWAYTGVHISSTKAKNLLYFGVPFLGLFAFLIGLL